MVYQAEKISFKEASISKALKGGIYKQIKKPWLFSNDAHDEFARANLSPFWLDIVWR